MINLLKVAALPGSGGGSMSALKAEEGVGLAKPTVQMKAPYFAEPKDDRPEWLRLGAAMPSSPYFEGQEA